ncbi:hypothetical protein B0H15DRAFT_955869 [Mycena belliarum]|uniref:Uncharacterized protein n=1 Tax=Mycena belliarum TaxID=1033014 RepID=A0AAD6TQN6_9AGAR|nr:hypothetical protein B0H15DRAFT_955869 [Mycena belliae]
MPLACPLCLDLLDAPNTLPQPALSRLRRRHHQPHASPPLPSTSGAPDHRCRYSGHIPQRSPPYFDAFDASSEARWLPTSGASPYVSCASRKRHQCVAMAACLVFGRVSRDFRWPGSIPQRF